MLRPRSRPPELEPVFYLVRPTSVKLPGAAILFITHDLGVVAKLCDRVAVMHGGEVVESGPCGDLFASPRHACPRSLLDPIPLPEIDPGWIGRGADADVP